jgi:hypothetical protein
VTRVERLLVELGLVLAPVALVYLVVVGPGKP